METTTITTPSEVQSPPRSKLRKFFYGVGVLFLMLIVGLGVLMYQGVKQAPEVTKVVSLFMQTISSGDLTGAYDMTSADFKTSLPQSEFSDAMGVFKAQYSGFESQKQTGFSIEANAGKPTQYKYSGLITYDDGDKGEVSAILIKENNIWKISYIKVNVTVKRMQKFSQPK